MAEFNSKHYPPAQTVLLKADDSLSAVSSTAVRERLAANEPIDDIVPKEAVNVIMKKI